MHEIAYPGIPLFYGIKSINLVQSEVRLSSVLCPLSSVFLSFEENHKGQNAHQCYSGRHHEDLTPLEFLFFPEFVHHDAGKLGAQEQADAGSGGKKQCLHGACYFGQ